MVRVRIRVAATLFAFAVFATAPAHAQDYDRADLIPTAIEVYNERATDPLPFLTADQIDDLLKGDVVRIRRRNPQKGDDAPERVTGFVLLEHSRRAAWLAALNPDFPQNSMLTQVRLMQDDLGRSMWYQHLSLPWPITDRHWVVELDKDHEMARSTEGFIWVQQWRLADDGPALAADTVARGAAGDLTPAKVEKAIYLPANEGAWILFSLDAELTLLAYRVTTVVGGGIPDSWIATFAMAQLRGLLSEIDALAATAEADYDPDVSPIYDGLGALMERRSTHR